MQASSSRRHSNAEMRGRAPLPVSAGGTPQNGHTRTPSALDVARSPPNQSNKSESILSLFYFFWECDRLTKGLQLLI